VKKCVKRLDLGDIKVGGKDNLAFNFTETGAEYKDSSETSKVLKHISQ